MKNLSILEIEKILSDKSVPKNLSTILRIFMAAINDWPTEVKSVEDYRKKVEHFIRHDATKDNIEKSLETIDFSKDAWQAESLTQILDVFKFSENRFSLREVIENLQI